MILKKATFFSPLKSPWIAGQFTIWLLILTGSFLIACLLRFTSLNAEFLPIMAYSINALSIFTGGLIAGKSAGKKGWYYGGFQGVIYTLSLLLIGFLAFDQMIQINPFLFLVFAFGLGAIGGIWGEKIKK